MSKVARAATAVAIGATVLAACSGGGEPRPTDSQEVAPMTHEQEPSPATGDEFTLPSASGAAKSLAPAVASISGTLGFDDIEGGCAYVEADDGTRYEVVYPDGWTLDRASGELRSDDGRTLRVGDRLTVRGTLATDRASICQIGPIFVASDVEIDEP